MFEKTDKCTTKPNFLHDKFPPGICLTMRTPKDGIELLSEEGLYVYENSISPLWPDVFFIDGSKMRPSMDPMLALATDRPVEAFNHLSHVSGYSDNDTDHMAIVEKRKDRPDKTSLLIDQISLSFSPPLPGQILEHLIKSTVGDEYFSEDDNGDKIKTFDPGELVLSHDLNQGQELFEN